MEFKSVWARPPYNISVTRGQPPISRHDHNPSRPSPNPSYSNMNTTAPRPTLSRSTQPDLANLSLNCPFDEKIPDHIRCTWAGPIDPQVSIISILKPPISGVLIFLCSVIFMLED